MYINIFILLNPRIYIVAKVNWPRMCLINVHVWGLKIEIGYSPLGFSTLSCDEILLLLELISILLDVRFPIYVWFYIFLNALLTGPNSILIIKFKAYIKCTTFELINACFCFIFSCKMADNVQSIFLVFIYMFWVGMIN